MGLVTVALWLTSVLMHGIGSQIFAAYFEHAQKNWGPDGRVIAERLIFFVALGIGLTVVAITSMKVLRSPGGRRAVPELLVRWAVGLLCAWGVNRYLICIQSESIHFVQYGVVAFGLSYALGNPRLGFALAVFGGFLDESNQWWRMYFHEVDNHLDWSDMCLNTAGAINGALPFTSLGRIKRYAEGKEDVFDPSGSRLPAVLAIGAIGAIAVYLRTSCTLGHDQMWPYLTCLDQYKPFHQFTQKEGIPALLGFATLCYFTVDERRRGIPIGAFLVALAAWHIGLTLPSNKGEVIHEDVPRVRVPHTKGPIAIDGKLDEADWKNALEIELHSFAPDADEEQRAKAAWQYGPELKTKARLLWDETALYVGFECESKDVWGRDLPRDHAKIANDEVVEAFLDLDAAERSYYEFEVSAANRQADYFCYFPELPQWIPAPTIREFVNLPGWDSRNLKTAVSVQGGECDVIAEDAAAAPRTKPPTEGYTVEMAIPWGDMKGRAVTPDFVTGASPLKPGARLRANFYRVEVLRSTEPKPMTFMSWSPTHAPLDFHRPQFFGELTLGE